LLIPYLMIFLGAVSNLFAIYFMKDAAGMSKPWPTFGMIVSILLKQSLISQANILTLTVIGIAIASLAQGECRKGCGGSIPDNAHPKNFSRHIP
jgi:multidrug transporter EmrE-like cation transporter